MSTTTKTTVKRQSSGYASDGSVPPLQSTLVQPPGPIQSRAKTRTNSKSSIVMNSNTGTTSNIGTPAAGTRSRNTTTQMVVPIGQHPLHDTGDPRISIGNTGSGSINGGDDNDGNGGASNEHKSSRRSKPQSIAVIPPFNGGTRVAGTSGGGDGGGNTYSSSTITRNYGNSVPTEHQRSNAGARITGTSSTPFIQNGGGDGDDGDDWDSGGSDGDGYSNDGGDDGGTPPIKPHVTSTRNKVKLEPISNGGDDDGYFTLAHRYHNTDIFKTLTAVPDSLKIKNTEMATVKKWKREMEVYLKQANAWDYAVMPSEGSWMQVKYRYADASNAWSIYSDFRSAHSKLAITLCSTMVNVYPDLQSEMSTLAETHLRANPSYVDEKQRINPRFTVNAYTGTFIADNANLVYTTIMKRLENVKTSTFHITNTVNAVHSIKYDPSMDPERYVDAWNDKMNELDAVIVDNKPLNGRLYPENIRSALFINSLPANGEYGTIRTTALNSVDGMLTVEQVVNMMKKNWQYTQSKRSGAGGGTNTGGGGNSSGGGTNRTGGGQYTRSLSMLCEEHNERDPDLLETFSVLKLSAAGDDGGGGYNGGSTNKSKRNKKKGTSKHKAGAVITFITTVPFDDENGGDVVDCDTSTGTVQYSLQFAGIASLEPGTIKKILKEYGPLTKEFLWIFDTGSTKSTTHMECLLVAGTIETVPALSIVGINCSKPLKSTRAGDAQLNNNLTLLNVHVVPGSGVNIVSASELKKIGCEFMTKGNFLDVYYRDRTIISFTYVSGLWVYCHPKRFVNVNDEYDEEDINAKITKVAPASSSSTSTNSTSTSNTTISNDAAKGRRSTRKVPRKDKSNTSKKTSSTGGASNTGGATNSTSTSTSGPSVSPNVATAVSHFVVTDVSTSGTPNAVITTGTDTIGCTSTKMERTSELVSVGNNISNSFKTDKDGKTHVNLGPIHKSGIHTGNIAGTGTNTGTHGTSEQSIGSSISMDSSHSSKEVGDVQSTVTVAGTPHINAATSNECTSVLVTVGNNVITNVKTMKHSTGTLASVPVVKTGGAGDAGTVTVNSNAFKSTGKVKYGPKMVITSGGPTGTVPVNVNSVGWKVTTAPCAGTTITGTIQAAKVAGTTKISDNSRKTSTGTKGKAGNGIRNSAGTQVKAGGGGTITVPPLSTGTGASSAIVLKAVTVKQTKATTVHQIHCERGHITITKAMLQGMGFTGDTSMVGTGGYSCSKCAPTKMKANYTGGGTHIETCGLLEGIDWDINGHVSYVNTFTKFRERVHSFTGGAYKLVGRCRKSKFVFTFTLKHKNEAAQHMINTVTYIKTQYGITVKHFHSDGGTEFINNHVKKFCDRNGIKQTWTTAGTPQHNGGVERMNGKLMGMVKSMLYTSGATTKLWCEAFDYAALIHNVTPTHGGGPSPMKQVTGTDFNDTKLQPFGCDCFVLPLVDTVGKLQVVGQPGIFVGIAVNQLDSPMVMDGTRKITVSKNVSIESDSFDHVALLSLDENALTTTDVICDEHDDGDAVNNTGNGIHAGWYGNGGTSNTGTSSTSTGGAKVDNGKTIVDAVTGKQRISYAGDDSSGDEFSDFEPSDDESPSSGTSDDESSSSDTFVDDVPVTGTTVSNGTRNSGTSSVLSPVKEEDYSSSIVNGDHTGGDNCDDGTTIKVEELGNFEDSINVPIQPLPALDDSQQISSRGRIMSSFQPFNIGSTSGTSYVALEQPVLPFESSMMITGTEPFLAGNDDWAWNAFNGAAVSYHSEYSYAARGGLLANFQSSNDMIINSNITEEDYIETVYSTINEPYEPNTYKQAMKTREAAKWRAAISEEYQSLHDNKVLVLVKRTSNMNILGTRLVFKVKTDENNAPVRWKARLVAKGYDQREGVDFHDTYSPVARFSSMRTLIALAAVHNLEMKQLDFKTAFLNASLDEDIYIGVPPGYNDITGTPINEKTHCFKLDRALYGLKQSPLEWYKLLHIILTACGYKNTAADPCFYYKHVPGCSIPIMITVYVDDCIIAYDKSVEHVWLADKAKICETYKIDDLDDINFCLKMKIERDRIAGTIKVSQYGYVQSLLTEYKLSDLKPADNPCLSGDLTSVNESQPEGEVPLGSVAHGLYRSMVGSLMYLGNTTRLDICFAVHFLARFLQGPLVKHMKAVKHIFRYLISHPNYVLVYGNTGTTGSITGGVNDTGAINFPNGTEYSSTVNGGPCYGGTTDKSAGTVHYHYLNGYTDSDWAADTDTRCSTSGGIVTLNGNIISWLCQKQKSVAQSSTESEFYAVNALACEVVWFQELLLELFGSHLLSVLFIDNQAAMHWTTGESMGHKRSKHIDVRYKWVRQLINEERIKVQWKPSANQLADILTKNTTKSIFVNLRDQLLGQGGITKVNGGAWILDTGSSKHSMVKV